MKLITIGTPICPKCKNLSAKLESYCKEHNIDHEYMNLSDAPQEIKDILVAKNIRQAPVVLIYRDNETLLFSGDDIFVELESL